MEGTQLSYYDNRPTSAAASSKGVIKLTAMTSVTAYSPTHRQPEPYAQIANCEIYILTPSKLLTLARQIAALAMGQSREQIPLLSTRTTLAVPFQPSHINYRHSLTSLTTMEENDNKHLSKCSRTMEYKEFKSGSTGNMLDRQVVMANRETDTETSSEEDITKGQEGGIDTTSEGLRYKCHMKKSSGSTEMSNEGVIIDERMENFSERSNVMIVNDQKVASLQQQVAKTTQVENKIEENEILKSRELQSVQIQESKVKTRKFFGRREAKTNSVQMSCAKVYKKSRETVVTDRVDADPKLFQALKGDKRSKLEESYSKDETMLKKRITDSRSSNSSTDHKVSHSQVRGENSLPERSEGTKLPNRPKIKRVKSKKDSKGCQQPTDTQSYRKSKIAKTGELPDDGETKTKVKKMGFFSKLVKCKKNENSDEKTEEVERDPSPEMSRQVNITEDQQEPVEEVSPEKKILHLPRYRPPMGLLVPKDDAELQKKLLSRKMKIEADQESPVEGAETVTIKTASSMPLHEKDEDDDKVMTVNNEEAKPSLPPRAHTPAPPIPERKINPTQLDSKRNLTPENFPCINSKPRLSPKFPEKYQNPGAEIKSNYDIVKFKVKKKESVEKPALTCSQGMNPKVKYSFTSESSSTINTREVHMERIEGREEMEIKVSEREKTEINFEEKFGMVMPTIILQEIPSVSSSIRSLNTTDIEEEIMLDADINLGKRGRVDIQSMPFFETSSLNEHSSSEHRSSPTCSTPIPTVTVFSEIPSHPSIYTTTELSDTPSTSFMKTYFSASSASEDTASNKVDELGLLLSELDRINSAPLENIDSEVKPVLMEKEENVSYTFKLLLSFQ
ncbi:hypothetical protein J437_LFUL006547 [Ladona fulva]|uniref:Uncharacterized protein n=1 Tax=Ladona fulva TaxID=123851 RepID=A0A8K0KLX9_LADFU|nr:hypothetical protein J437_LFUL006547 [Ladona fulva]